MDNSIIHKIQLIQIVEILLKRVELLKKRKKEIAEIFQDISNKRKIINPKSRNPKIVNLLMMTEKSREKNSNRFLQEYKNMITIQERNLKEKEEQLEKSSWSLKIKNIIFESLINYNVLEKKIENEYFYSPENKNKNIPPKMKSSQQRRNKFSESQKPNKFKMMYEIEKLQKDMTEMFPSLEYKKREMIIKREGTNEFIKRLLKNKAQQKKKIKVRTTYSQGNPRTRAPSSKFDYFSPKNKNNLKPVLRIDKGTIRKKNRSTSQNNRYIKTNLLGISNSKGKSKVECGGSKCVTYNKLDF